MSSKLLQPTKLEAISLEEEEAAAASVKIVKKYVEENGLDDRMDEDEEDDDDEDDDELLDEEDEDEEVDEHGNKAERVGGENEKLRRRLPMSIKELIDYHSSNGKSIKEIVNRINMVCRADEKVSYGVSSFKSP